VEAGHLRRRPSSHSLGTACTESIVQDVLHNSTTTCFGSTGGTELSQSCNPTGDPNSLSSNNTEIVPGDEHLPLAEEIRGSIGDENAQLTCSGTKGFENVHGTPSAAIELLAVVECGNAAASLAAVATDTNLEQCHDRVAYLDWNERKALSIVCASDSQKSDRKSDPVLKDNTLLEDASERSRTYEVAVPPASCSDENATVQHLLRLGKRPALVELKWCARSSGAVTRKLR
jgi:hypothetical protein